MEQRPLDYVSVAEDKPERKDDAETKASAPKNRVAKPHRTPIRRASNSQNITVQSPHRGKGMSVEVDFSSVKEFKKSVSAYLESSDCPIAPTPIACAAGKAFRQAVQGGQKTYAAKKVSLSKLPTLSFKSYDDLKSGLSSFLEAAECPVATDRIAHESALAYLANVVLRNENDMPDYPEGYEEYRGHSIDGDALVFYNRQLRAGHPKGPHLLYLDELRKFDFKLVRALDRYCQTRTLQRQSVFPPAKSLRTEAIAYGVISPSNLPEDARLKAACTIINRPASRTYNKISRKRHKAETALRHKDEALTHQ